MKKRRAIAYSPSEQKVLDLLTAEPQDTNILCKRFYRKRIEPYHGRVVMVGILQALVRKTAINKERWRVMASPRRGPRAIEFWLETRA